MQTRTNSGIMDQLKELRDKKDNLLNSVNKREEAVKEYFTLIHSFQAEFLKLKFLFFLLPWGTRTDILINCGALPETTIKHKALPQGIELAALKSLDDNAEKYPRFVSEMVKHVDELLKYRN